MSFMPWNEELFTGISKVDEQHKWLVDATNQLHDEISKATPDHDTVSQILRGLVEYTFKHFIMEEEMFKRLGYTESEAHLAQHNQFTNDITELLQRHVKGEVVSFAAMDLLKEWLVKHIMKTDKAYVPFLKQHGVN